MEASPAQMMLHPLASCLPVHEVDEENEEKFPFNETKLKVKR